MCKTENPVLEDAVCEILEGIIPKKEIKDNIPNIDEVVGVIKENKTLQSLFKDLVDGKIDSPEALASRVSMDLQKIETSTEGE